MRGKTLHAKREWCCQIVMPLLLIVAVQAVFSGYTVLTDASLKSGTSPVVFALLRDCIATSTFAPALWVTERMRPDGERQFFPRREHFGHFIALGLLGVWGGLLLGVLAIENLSASIYGLLTPTVPAITLVISYAAGIEHFKPREAASWLKVGGIAVSIAGACVIVLVSPNGSAGKNNSLGLGYILVQKTCMGAYPVLQKHMLAYYSYSSLTLATWAYVLGTVAVAMTAAVAATDPTAWSMSTVACAGVFYSGILSSFFNFTSMAWVNARTSPLTVMMFYPLQSVFTPLLSTVFLGTTVLQEDIYGGALVVAGLGLCIAGRFLGGAPGTGIVEEAEDAEASTVTLSVKDVQALLSAAEESAAAAPFGHRVGRARSGLIEQEEELEDEEEEVARPSFTTVPLSDKGRKAGSYGSVDAATSANSGNSSDMLAAMPTRHREATAFADVAAPILDRALTRRGLGTVGTHTPLARALSGLAPSRRSQTTDSGGGVPLTVVAQLRRRALLSREKSVLVEHI